MSLFRPADKRVSLLATGSTEADAGDQSDVDDSLGTVEYVASAPVISARLELMGYSLDFALRELSDWLASQRESRRETMKELASVLPPDHSDEAGPLLDTITADAWMA